MRKVCHLGAMVLVTLLIGCSGAKEWPMIHGQTPNRFQKTISKNAGLNFLLYIPKDVQTSEKKWPLIIFLHGMGECGNDLTKLKMHSLPKIVEAKDDFPFIVVSPQCPLGERWEAVTLNALLDEVIANLPVDTNRVYLTGLSMGGFGTWKFAAAYPSRFAAIAPVCGGGSLEDTWRLREMPVWAFHGAKDNIVLPEESVRMVEALKRMGNTQVKFTLYPEANHNSWDATYANPELYEWFLQHTKK